jgi:hypothetical protein
LGTAQVYIDIKKLNKEGKVCEIILNDFKIRNSLISASKFDIIAIKNEIHFLEIFEQDNSEKIKNCHKYTVQLRTFDFRKKRSPEMITTGFAYRQ